MMPLQGQGRWAKMLPTGEAKSLRKGKSEIFLSQNYCKFEYFFF
jgi:hypothetical protein